MSTVTISPKFQVVIPKELREAMHLSVGMKVAMIPYEGRIELIPLGPIQALRGSLPGIDTTIKREKDRRL